MILTSFGVSSPAFILLINAELAESRYKDILTGSQIRLDNFKEILKEFSGLVLDQSCLCLQCLQDV